MFRHNRIFRHSCMCKQPMLIKQWNDNIFVKILNSSLRYTDTLLDVFFLLLAVILSELHDKPRRKDRVTKALIQKKNYLSLKLFHDGSPYHKETSPLICRANYQQNTYKQGIFQKVKAASDIIIKGHIQICYYQKKPIKYWCFKEKGHIFH